MTAIKDLNETGICITTNICFAAGEAIYLRIQFPSKPFQWLEFKGRVIESKAGGLLTRVEFTDLSEYHKASIQEYIKWFLSAGKGGG